MEAILKKACADHDLTGISVSMFDPTSGRVTVFIHWAAGSCADGRGETFEEAISVAVAEMKQFRTPEAA